jgi:hypothetical protein
VTKRFASICCAGGAQRLRRFPGTSRSYRLAATQPDSASPPFYRDLARHRESFCSALQQAETEPRRYRQTSIARGRAEDFAHATNSRNHSLDERRNLFGNHRARSARFDEGRRNDFSPRTTQLEAKVMLILVRRLAQAPLQLSSVMTNEVQTIDAEELKSRLGELRRFL